MSVRQVSVDVQIAAKVAAVEVKTMLRLGATVREAMVSAHRAGEEVLSIARRSDICPQQ
jgi:hypothetical protein